MSVLKEGARGISGSHLRKGDLKIIETPARPVVSIFCRHAEGRRVVGGVVILARLHLAASPGNSGEGDAEPIES